MLAVKAEYDNGTVRWLQQPPATRACSVLVIFDDVSEETKSAQPNDENALWYEFALDSAMRGMEDEDSFHTESDIKG